MNNHNKNKGFTLIELLVVIAVIGVLSGVVLQSLSSARVKSRNTQRIANIDQISKALQVATTGTTNQFPSSSGASRCLGKNPCWSTANPFSSYPAVDSAITAGITGGSAPVDPFFTTGQDGDAYLYNSSLTTTVPAPGAYLIWVMEDQPGAPCGRGIPYAVVTTPNYGCALYLGPPTP